MKKKSKKPVAKQQPDPAQLAMLQALMQGSNSGNTLNHINGMSQQQHNPYQNGQRPGFASQGQ